MLVRYRFPGARLLDAIVDLPFALPTAVAGIALTALFAENGLARRAAGAARHQGRVHAARHPGRADLHRPAVRGAHRAAGAAGPRARDRGGRREPGRQPLADLPARHAAARSLPALLTGFALAFARAVGEYGSVIFIAGNLPIVSEIAPLLIVIQLEEFRYADATAIAVVMLLVAPSCCCSPSTGCSAGRRAAPPARRA